MRPWLAIVLTTAVPAAVGVYAVRGSRLIRLVLGAQLGMVFVAGGAAVGASLASVLPTGGGGDAALFGGGFLGLAALGFIGARWPMTVDLPRASRLSRAIWIVAGLLGIAFLVLAFFRPIPNWDAWTMWSMKAKAIASTGSFDHPVFTAIEYRYTHPEYPPLLPSWQALAYVTSGDLQTSFPLQVQLAWLWIASSLGLLMLVSRWGSAAVVLTFGWLAAPQMLDYVLTGYGEIPMAGLLATGSVLWLLPGERLCHPTLPRGNSWVPGAFLAGAALIKPEGLVFGVVVVAALLLRANRDALRDAFRCAASWVLAGAALWWIAMMRMLDLGTPFFTRDVLGARPRTLDTVERFGVVAESLLRRLVFVGDWLILVPIVVAVLLIIGRPNLRLLSAAVAATLAMGLAYIVTPYNVEWQLRTSVPRTLMVPVGLLTLAAALRPLPGRRSRSPQGDGDPEERLSRMVGPEASASNSLAKG